MVGEGDLCTIDAVDVPVMLVECEASFDGTQPELMGDDSLWDHSASIRPLDSLEALLGSVEESSVEKNDQRLLAGEDRGKFPADFLKVMLLESGGEVEDVHIFLESVDRCWLNRGGSS